MPEQIELFPTLPLALRPPRRLRRLGFELELLRRDVETGADIRRRIEDTEACLAALVAKAKAAGRVPRDAYRLVVKHEELRETLDEKLRDIDELQRTLERQLAKGIETHLARVAKCA